MVFKPLARTELRQVLEIELQGVQERIFQNLSDPFIFSVTDAGKEFLLREGTNLNYGARHLKRAIDRLVVHPMSNLIATGQILSGDAIRVDHPNRFRFDGLLSGGRGIPSPEKGQAGESLSHAIAERLRGGHRGKPFCVTVVCTPRNR